MKTENRSEIMLERINYLAREQGISKSFICDKMGVTKPYFNDIKRSGREISPVRLKVIAQVLHTTPEYLRGETDDKELPFESIPSYEKLVEDLRTENLKLRALIRELKDDNWELRSRLARVQSSIDNPEE